MFNPQGIINILGIYCISILKNMWKDLNIEQRSELIKLGVQNGIKDLGAIKNVYNNLDIDGHEGIKYDLGGYTTRPKKETTIKPEDQIKFNRFYYNNVEDFIQEHQRNHNITDRDSAITSILEQQKEHDAFLKKREVELRQKPLTKEQLEANRRETEKINSYFKAATIKEQDPTKLHRAANLIQDHLKKMATPIITQDDIKTHSQKVQQERKDAWDPYKKGIEATMTAAELFFSGASLLGAYGNLRKWQTAGSAVKRGIVNFLNKNQLPMQVGGTIIDGVQTVDDINKGNTFGAVYNGVGAGLGTAGSIGASDIFRTSRFHNPKIDRFLDTAGLIQNGSDFIKWGYDSFIKPNINNTPSVNTATTNTYARGGYKSSQSIRDRIAKWEGDSMKTNRAFELEDRDFYNAIPSDIRGKMTQDELDALYSYSYNVGAGNFKKRVVPQLVNLYNSKGNIEDVQNSMWASRDKELRGLTKRRNVEKQLFANAYNKNKGQSVIEPLSPSITNPEPVITPLQETNISNPQYNSVVNWQPAPLPVIEKEAPVPIKEDIDLGLDYSFTPSRLVTPELILPTFS